MSQNASNNFKKFELGRWISVLYRNNRWYMEQQMAVFDLGGGQHVFLFFLYSNNGASQDEISRALQLDKATAARAIQKLEDRGFVTRQVSEKDKRVNHVFLTQKAYDIEQQLRGFSEEWKAILVEDMSTEEVECLEKLINKLNTNASNYRSSMCKKGGHHVK